MHNKNTSFARLRNCRLKFLGLLRNFDIRSKKVNANDNFANDNQYFAAPALAAVA